jgi:hypothetical protein
MDDGIRGRVAGTFAVITERHFRFACPIIYLKSRLTPKPVKLNRPRDLTGNTTTQWQPGSILLIHLWF